MYFHCFLRFYFFEGRKSVLLPIPIFSFIELIIQRFLKYTYKIDDYLRKIIEFVKGLRGKVLKTLCIFMNFSISFL